MTYAEIIAKLEAGQTGSAVEVEIFHALNPSEQYGEKLRLLDVAHQWDWLSYFRSEWTHTTTSRNAAAALIERVLPGWWYLSGSCYLTCHASLGPDHNDPEHSDRLHRDFPPAKHEGWNGGFHADIPHPTTEAAALLHCLLQAIACNEEHQRAD